MRNNYWPSFTFFPFKVIYVIRNPRDVLISGYFFWGKTNLVKEPESLETYFEWFLKGNGEYPVKYRRCEKLRDICFINLFIYSRYILISIIPFLSMFPSHSLFSHSPLLWEGVETPKVFPHCVIYQLYAGLGASSLTEDRQGCPGMEMESTNRKQIQGQPQI